MNRSCLAFTICTLILLASFAPVRAQDTQATSSAQDAVTETLKERVQKVLSAETSQGTDSTDIQQNFALVGTLEKLVGSTIQVSTVTGESKVCELNKTVSIVRAGKAISREEIELNSSVIAIGKKGPDGTLSVEKLKIVDESVFPTKRQTILGIFGSLTTKALAVGLLDSPTGGLATYPITTKTTFLDALGGKMNKKDLTSGTRVVVVLPESTNATPSAARVYVLK